MQVELPNGLYVEVTDPPCPLASQRPPPRWVKSRDGEHVWVARGVINTAVWFALWCDGAHPTDPPRATRFGHDPSDAEVIAAYEARCGAPWERVNVRAVHPVEPDSDMDFILRMMEVELR